MKLLIMGHSSHTGFGIVTEALGGRFIERGIDVRVLAVNHRGEPVRGPLAGRVWPLHLLRQQFRMNVTPAAISGALWDVLDSADEWVPDQVLAIADYSGLTDYIGEDGLEAWTGLPTWHYCPIEGDNLPPPWTEIWKTIRPVAMSQYGQQVIAQATGQTVPMIYHGVDTSVFHPATFSDPIHFRGKTLSTKRACKEMFGLDPDGFLVFRADRLVERKFYNSLLDAMTPVLQKHANVSLLIHCRPIDDGLDLGLEIIRMPFELHGRVRMTGMHDTFKGLPAEGLAALYNAADLYVSPTSGEGFGLTMAESLACGVPVVTTGHAAGIEVTGPGGILVPPLRDEYGNEIRYHSRYQMDWRFPNVPAFTSAIERLIMRPKDRLEMGRLGRAHVASSFSWDRAADEFTALFDSVRELAVAS